jgi:hypothetical protein
MEAVLDFNTIQHEFAKVHLLIDRLFQNENDLPQQNSYLFQVKTSLILSAIVQMKTSLLKFM